MRAVCASSAAGSRLPSRKPDDNRISAYLYPRRRGLADDIAAPEGGLTSAHEAVVAD